MVPVSFMWVTEMFVSPGPTPTVWPKGGTLSFTGGPYLSPSTWLRIDSASWSALPRLVSVPSNKAGWGVNGFVSFCQNKRPVLSPVEGASAAGPKPGNTGNPLDVKLGNNRWDTFTSQPLFTNPHMDSQHRSSSGKPRTKNSV